MWGPLLLSSFLAWASHGKVASLDLCADQWLLEFEVENALTTALSKNPEVSFHADGATHTYGATVEELLKHNVTLVLAQHSPSPTLRSILKKKGIRLVVLGPVQSLKDLMAITKKIGVLLSKETLAAHHIHTLKNLKAFPRQKRVLFMGGGQSTFGSKCLFNEILSYAGLENVMANTLSGWGYTNWEEVVAHAPNRIIFLGEDGAPCLTHPALKKTGLLNNKTSLPQRFTLCHTPSSIIALINRLKEIHETP